MWFWKSFRVLFLFLYGFSSISMWQGCGSWCWVFFVVKINLKRLCLIGYQGVVDYNRGIGMECGVRNFLVIDLIEFSQRQQFLMGSFRVEYYVFDSWVFGLGLISFWFCQESVFLEYFQFFFFVQLILVIFFGEGEKGFFYSFFCQVLINLDL